jgi:ribonuclease Z
MAIALTILGSNSAIPSIGRNPSAHLLSVNERLFLIDCAEGTQLQLRKFHIHFQRIVKIFISHMHGDHYFGLIGLLNTFHLLGRKEELHLYAPPELKEIIDLQLVSSMTVLNYPLYFHLITPNGYNLVCEDENVAVHSFPLLHSVPTCGFIFRQKKQSRKIRREAVEELSIPLQELKNIKNGADYTDDRGILHPNDTMTLDPPQPRSYAYCADTAYTESIIPYICGCDLLYHEATFMKDMSKTAKDKFHSTTIEAAEIARKAKVKKLLIGHFSARYDDLQPLLDEAKTVFPETFLAQDGAVLQV